MKLNKINKSPIKQFQKGFSLIELLLVITIGAILATVSIPSLFRAKRAAEKGAVINNLRTLSTHQMSYMSVNGRYARLTELNTFMGNNLGTITGTSLYRGEYRYRMYPSSNPTNSYLKDRFAMRGTRSERGFIVFEIRIDSDGIITIIEE